MNIFGFKIKVKDLVYWLSIVRPITDILVGTWRGISLAISNAKQNAQYNEEVQHFIDDDEVSEDLPEFLMKGK